MRLITHSIHSYKTVPKARIGVFINIIKIYMKPIIKILLYMKH